MNASSPPLPQDDDPAPLDGHELGHTAAERISAAFPERAARGTAPKLRAWQEEALAEYFRLEPKDFLVAATPGAGKTTFALRLASELLHRRVIDRITVVAPTEHLKNQWAEAAHRVGIRLDPAFANAQARFARHYHGVAVTYAQVAVKAHVHREITETGRTLVILDEVHHGGDALSWGDAIREAFDRAVRRVSLSGTPFRSDTAAIPFVRYLRDERGVRMSQTDYAYGYGRALADGVVRPVLFLSYAGSMRWRTRQGEEMEARLGDPDTKDVTSQAWRAALDPNGEWIGSVLKSADRRLTEIRHAVPDAGGLVIATDQDAARAYADVLQGITGERPTVVLSDEKASSERIEEFGRGTSRWMVAVRMVSEGVDVPRLCVGVYATSSATPLFFAQAIGRFVRARRRGETASVFLPSVPILLALAAQLELERDHALDRERADDGLDDSLIESANRDEKASEELLTEFEWAALGSEADFEKVLFNGEEFGQLVAPESDEEWDFIGLPGLLEPEQVSELLRTRQHRQARRISDRRRQEPAESAPPAREEPAPLHRTLKEQRTLLNQLVGMYARARDMPHGQVHAEVRRICGGPEVARASTTQLQTRIDWLKRRING